MFQTPTSFTDISIEEWSHARQSILCNDNIGRIGFKLGLAPCYCQNPRNPGPPSSNQMATIIEAIIGAIYEDSDRQPLRVQKVMQKWGIVLPVKSKPVSTRVALVLWVIVAWLSWLLCMS